MISLPGTEGKFQKSNSKQSIIKSQTPKINSQNQIFNFKKAQISPICNNKNREIMQKKIILAFPEKKIEK